MQAQQNTAGDLAGNTFRHCRSSDKATVVGVLSEAEGSPPVTRIKRFIAFYHVFTFYIQTHKYWILPQTFKIIVFAILFFLLGMSIGRMISIYTR